MADWYADGGKLTLDSSGLLCTADHRNFDAARLAVTWTDGKPTVHHPGHNHPGDDHPGDPP